MREYTSDRVFNGTRPLSVERVEKLKRRFGTTRPNGADMVIAVMCIAFAICIVGLELKFWHDCRSEYDRAVCYVGHH